MRKKRIYGFLLLLCSMLSSCVDDISFDQIDTLTITPVVATALINANITQNDLVINGSEVGTISQTTVVSVFNNNIVRNDLDRIVFRFEVDNQFNRDFRVDVVFLDDNDNSTNNDIVLNIDANTINYIQENEIVISANPEFLDTRKIQVRVTLLPSSDGSSIDTNIPASFIFKSAGTFYFSIN